MEIVDLAKEYLILRKLHGRLEEQHASVTRQIGQQSDGKGELVEKAQQLEKRIEKVKDRQDQVCSDIKAKGKELLAEQGRGVLELGQQGMVIAALVTGAPQSDRLMLDLINTKPEELEYAAELITEREKRKNQQLSERKGGGKKGDVPSDDLEKAKKLLLESSSERNDLSRQEELRREHERARERNR